MNNILIIGYGIVGQNVYLKLKSLHPDIVDKYKPFYNTIKLNKKYDLAFVCVNTPSTEYDLCDRTELYDAIDEYKRYMNDDGVIVIKSTILPGTCSYIINKFKYSNIVFSPEYYGETQHCNNFDFNFTILGGDKSNSKKVIQILQEVYDARHKFVMTDFKTAEVAKYMENSWIATKVSFCNQFAEICKNEDINYEELRELFILDPRVNPSHTFVYDNHPYWNSKCLNKDVPAIAEFENAELLKAIIEYNKKNQ